MTDKILTKEMLQQMLHYNEDTGHFTWLVTSNRKKAGERAGTPVPHGYRKIQVYGKIYYEHRLAWLYVHGAFPEEVVDHIDGNGTNNKIANLRSVSRSENMRNQSKPQKSSKLGILGVSQTKNGKFKAQIMNEKVINLGAFDTAEAASEAYVNAKRKLHSTCIL